MDDLVPVPVTKNLLDLAAFVTEDLAEFLARVVDDAAGELRAVRAADPHAGPPFEFPFDTDDAGGEEASAMLGKDVAGAFVDDGVVVEDVNQTGSYHVTIGGTLCDTVWVSQQNENGESAQTIFSDLLAGKERPDTMKEDLDGYRYAMKIEADSVRFYENAARRERKSAVKSLLLKIAEEEKKHFNIVENIYDFVLSPKYFLAWGEFSNLKDM